MVIHDLKHPTESIINQLYRLQDELLESRAQIRRLELVVENLNAKLHRLRPSPERKELARIPSASFNLGNDVESYTNGVN
jgi:septal ring factor EnvC (AmiA/AmiB activator)